MKASEYNLTKKEETIVSSAGISIFVFGTQGESRDLFEFLIWGIRAYNGECFSFPFWTVDWGEGGRFELTNLQHEQKD